MAGRRVRRRALPLAFAFALFLIGAQGASAATCTATASGGWSAGSTWSCGAAPGPADAVVIPAGKTVSVDDADTQSAGGLTLRGTLALGDQSELDVSDLAASGGTISGPQFAMLVVTVDTGEQATVDSAGLTVHGAYLNVTGDGTFAIAGPLALGDGGWVESDIDATWTGSAPWQMGGAAGTPTSGFEVFGAQLAIAGATAAQFTGSGDAAIQLDGGSTLVKQDATTSDLAVDVLIDGAAIQVAAGKLIGNFQGAGSLAIAAGATLGLAGSGLQIVPPAIDMAGGTLEVEPGADVSLVLPGAPALHRFAVGAKGAVDVSINDGPGGPAGESAPPDVLGDEIAIAAGGSLAVDGGAGALALTGNGSLSGSGTLDAALDNGAGTVSPNGALRITGEYSQGASGTLALDLRGAGDGDSLHVEGSTSLAGTLAVTTGYAPAATATPLVLATAAKPHGTFAKVAAPLGGGRAWNASYTAAGVELSVVKGGDDGAVADLVRPSLQPEIPVVGGRTRCLPGKWQGSPHLSYQWLRGGKPIASATDARYRVALADRGRPLACRVTASAAGAHTTATSKSARARVGLRIAAVGVASDGTLSLSLRCARGERRCAGSLRVLAGGHAVASGHFSLRSPGGVVELAPAGGAASLTGAAVVVRAAYRNGAGAPRTVKQRLLVA